MSPDRRVAAAGFLAAAAALAVTTALADPRPPPDGGTVRHDPAALAELTALLDAGDRGSWVVEYDYRRVLADGRATGARVTHARGDTVRITRDATSAEVVAGSARYHCTIVGEEVQCLASDPSGEEPLSRAEVVRTVVDLGAYAVTRLPGGTYAGEPARCFRVVAVRGVLAALGAETVQCLAADGVPLRTRVAGAVRTDEWVAVAVERDPPPERYTALLRELALSAGAPATTSPG